MSEAQAVTDSFLRMEATISSLKSEIEEIKLERESWKSTALGFQSQNEDLRKVINRSNNKADHYMKQNAAVLQGLKTLVSIILDLVKQVEKHDFQNGTPAPELEPVKRMTMSGPAPTTIFGAKGGLSAV